MPAEDLEKKRLLNRLHQAEEKIRSLEEQTRVMLDSIHTGIIILDAELHTIVDVNPAAAELIGVEKNGIIGHLCHKYICPAEVGNCPITDKGQLVDNSERVLITADGRTTPILKTVASFNLDGRPHLIESFLDISHLKTLQKDLEHLACTDSITGAHNRRHFIQLTEQEILRARRYRFPLSVVMIDIDHFKRVNDLYGHLVGDSVLRELVSVLNTQMRPGDILGRFGGEEFSITLVECDLEKAKTVSERLRKNIEEHRMISEGKEISIQISIGVAQLASPEGNWEALIKRADQALYRAKAAGRNRVEASTEPE